MAIIHYLSLASLRLSVFNSMDTQIGLASGFFYENDRSDLFIITNWHVVTGRRPQTPRESETGAIPTHLKFSLAKRQLNGETAIKLNELLEYKLDVNNDDGNSPMWLEHPELKYHVDVVALPIPDRSVLADAAYHTVNAYPAFEPRYTPTVMDSVVVIGFPWGLSAGGALPIFKRGSVASEPIVPINGLPRFLIDCRTTSAMSGSPIIAMHSGIWKPTHTEGLSRDSVIGTVENFIGVYSGRLKSADLSNHIEREITELGIAWRKDALDKIVSAGVPGTTLDQLLAR